MAKQTTIDEQANTPAPGAEGTAENKTSTTESQPAAAVVETPEWVAKMLESNQAVIKSNEALVESNEKLAEAISTFKEDANSLIGSIEDNAKSLVETIVEKTAPGSKGQSGQKAEVPFNPVADYEVAEGKSFRDSKDFSKEYKEGDDVTHLGEDVLKRLLSQGLIEEA